MKTRIWIILLAIVLLIGGITIGLNSTQVDAKKKKKTKTKVTMHLSKKGTLTIKGKGKMPKKVTKYSRKKIKKVVIKKGITSVCNSAFDGCEKLKKVKTASTIKRIGSYAFKNTSIKSITIPKKTKTICGEAFGNCKKLKTVTMPGSFYADGLGDEGGDYIFNTNSIKTIKLSTGLNVGCACYMRAANIVVSKKDKKYKSINGIVYSKNGKDIVRVPYLKKTVNIKEGCKTVYVEAFLYGMKVWDDDEMCYSHTEQITIPKSVTKISHGKYGYGGVCENPSLKKVTINTQSLDEISVQVLLKYFSIYGTYDQETTLSRSVMPGDIMSQLKNYTHKDGMYISPSKVLILYEGKDKVLTIPDGVVKISSDALSKRAFDSNNKNGLEKIIMSDSIEEVEDNAFYNIESLKEIVWSKSLKKIGSYLIGNTNITDLTLPESVPEMGDNTFAFSNVKNVVIPEGYTTLPAYAFWACTNLKTVKFPSTFKKLKKSTFDAIDGLNIRDLIKGTDIIIVNG